VNFLDPARSPKQLDLRSDLKRAAAVFKFYMPYDETDHILNIALNLMTGGTCLEHLENRRTDEAYLNTLGVRRIPDPTTAGDFCRRFDQSKILNVMQAINKVRQRVWKQQPKSFFNQATIEADGSFAETSGEKKQGIGLNYKGQWGYHPLVVSLAETQEVLYLANRSGNRPSHQHASYYLDQAIAQCRQAGFWEIMLRGDTDFSQTEHLDRWQQDNVQFVFGYDATRNLVAKADSIEKTSWEVLRHDKTISDPPRATRANHKENVVVAKGYKNLKLSQESYAEFDYRPTCCSRSYRMIVLRKEIECYRGQLRLFPEDEVRYYFYITNASKDEMPAREVIRNANRRCNQENAISQFKASHCLEAPLDSLMSNWAYMVFASLAWTLKQWSGMLVRVQGNSSQRKKQGVIRRWVLKMEFATYLNSLIMIPAQVIRSARQLRLRLLAYRPTVESLLILHEQIAMPLRH